MKLRIEEMELPAIDEADILATIQHAKIIIKEKTPIKIEPRTIQVIKDILFIYGKKTMLLQSLLAILLLIGIWLMIPSNNQTMMYAYFVSGCCLMSLTMSVELLRSRICNMWELEVACPYSPSRLLIWKTTCLSVIAFVGIFITSLLLSYGQNDSFMVLLIGGCFPFILLCALSIHLQKYIHNPNTLLALYGIGFINLFLVAIDQWILLMERWGSWLLLASIAYLFFVLWKQKQVEYHL